MTRLWACSITIGYDSNPGLFGVRPVLEDLSDIALVLDADILSNGVRVKSYVLKGVQPTKPSGRL